MNEKENIELDPKFVEYMKVTGATLDEAANDLGLNLDEMVNKEE